MQTTWTFSSAGQIVFGSGAIERLPDLLHRLQLKRVFLVTDQKLAAVGLVDTVRAAFGSAATLQVFLGGEPEPSLRVADAAVAAACAFQPDGLIGLGGGSNLDLAKITAATLTYGGSPRDYLGEDQVPGPILPLIAVPTTAGTGSEVSSAGVFTDEENRVKAGAMSNYLRPTVALVDPRLTLSCPRKVTTDSGMDALTHAIEAYTAVDFADLPIPAGQTSLYQGRHPLGNCLAETAIRLIGENLLTAVNEPQNLPAREAMSLAAMLAGLAFSNVGVALVHALEYPIGAATHCTHGEGNGLLLPHVMRYNLTARQKEFSRIAALLGADVDGLSEQRAAECAIGAVEQLNHALGIRSRLSELGAQRDQLPEFAEKALAISRIIRVNPRVPTVSEIVALLNSAY